MVDSWLKKQKRYSNLRQADCSSVCRIRHSSITLANQQYISPYLTEPQSISHSLSTGMYILAGPLVVWTHMVKPNVFFNGRKSDSIMIWKNISRPPIIIRVFFSIFLEQSFKFGLTFSHFFFGRALFS